MKKTIVIILLGFILSIVVWLAILVALSALGIPVFDLQFDGLNYSIWFIVLVLTGYMATARSITKTPIAAIGIGLFFPVMALLGNGDGLQRPSGAALLVSMAIAPLLGWVIYKAKSRKGTLLASIAILSLPCFAVFSETGRSAREIIDQTRNYKLSANMNMAQIHKMVGEQPRISKSKTIGCSNESFLGGMLEITVAEEYDEVFWLTVKKPFAGSVDGIRLGTKLEAASKMLMDAGFTVDEHFSRNRTKWYYGQSESVQIHFARSGTINEIDAFNNKFTTKPVIR